MGELGPEAGGRLENVGAGGDLEGEVGSLGGGPSEALEGEREGGREGGEREIWGVV